VKYVRVIIAFAVAAIIIAIGYSLLITAPAISTPIVTDNPETETFQSDVVSSDRVEVLETDEGREIPHSLRDSVVSFARQYLGTPYVYGSCSKDGFDCSGFVYFVFKHFKINVPRSSSEYNTYGETISIQDVQKGDILVFLSPTRNEIGHLGIVTSPAGMETEFIHATSGKEMKVVYSSLKQEGYKRRFVKSIRVL